MQQYHNLLRHVMSKGKLSDNRTGVQTLRVFSPPDMEYDLSEGFPLVTSKKVHLKSVIHELLWFLKGDTNIAYLKENNVRIWDEWADYDNELGPVYGHQWRNLSGVSTEGELVRVDQIAELIQQIKANPNSRRLIVSSWNPIDIPDMALAPCHCFFQCFVEDGTLSLKLYQRSADLFLGVPFNIASYALLTMMLAQVCNLKPGRFIHSIGDAHIYMNHMDQVQEQLSRDLRPLPEMILDETVTNIDDFKYDSFSLVGYDPHPTIKGDVAV